MTGTDVVYISFDKQNYGTSNTIEKERAGS